MTRAMRTALGFVACWCLLGCSKRTPPAPEAASSSTQAHQKAAVSAVPTPSSSVLSPVSSTRPPTADVFTTALGKLTISPIAHGTFRFEVGERVVYVDPAGKHVERPQKLADLVLLTDIHADHFDQQALARVTGPETKVVAPPVVAEKYEGAIVLKNGDRREVLGMQIEATPMYNLKRGPEPGKLFHDKGRGNGYLLTLGETRLYISGDTECTPEMKALANIDIAFVTMNLPYTMPPEEAAECVNAFKPKVVYPFHYRGSDLTVFQKATSSSNVEVRLREWYPGRQQK